MSIAVKTRDGKVFTEAIDCLPARSGVAWIVNFIDKADVAKVVIDGANGSQILADAMKAARLKKPIIPKVAEIVTANALFEQGIASGILVHMDQPAVTQVVGHCEKRRIGSNGGFGYQSQLQGADISILDSMILAFWLASECKEKRKQTVSY
jgi:phage terminase large subunit-like protein